MAIGKVELIVHPSGALDNRYGVRDGDI